MAELRSGPETIAIASSATEDRDFDVPSSAARWTVIATPLGAGDAITLQILYWDGSDFYPRNSGGTPVSMPYDTVNVVTSEDAVTRVRARIVAGATPPSGGIRVSFLTSRGGPG